MTTAGFHLYTRLFEPAPWQVKALCAQPKYLRYENCKERVVIDGKERTCRRNHGRDELWFSERNASNRKDKLLHGERVAKSICARCPVRKDCLEFGWDEEDGIWGGSLPWERRRFKAEPNRIEAMLEYLDDQAAEKGLVAKEEVA